VLLLSTSAWIALRRQAAAVHRVEAGALGADPGEGSLLARPPVDPEDGRALVARLGPERLVGSPELAPLVVAWYAGVDPAGLDRETLSLVAVSTARLLGARDDPRRSPAELAEEALAGLELVRGALERRCGDCAPAPGALPPVSPDVGESAAIQGERIARAASPELEQASELGSLVGDIRRGEPVPDRVWERAGFCGMAALELGRAGDEGALPALLRAAEDGPTAMDRLAALYGAASLVDAASWPEGPARERATALGWVQGAGSR
jgi:hypothetical protein